MILSFMDEIVSWLDNPLDVLTEEGKWFFFVVIIVSNVVFLFAWLRNLSDAFV